MLSITIPGEEHWDEESETFHTVGDLTLKLEHSLVSLSKWEQKFEKPFLGAGEKTNEEVMAYIEAMILSKKIPPGVISSLTEQHFLDINAYINAKATATYFREEAPTRGREVITSELIYFWMISFNIPWEAQYWHLNRLFALIKVCDVKNKKPKKQTRADMLAERQRLNEQRRKQFNTSG